jgi:DUF1680 family protein
MYKISLTVIFLLAVISVFAQSYLPERQNAKLKIKPVVPIQAYGFNLKDVKLLDGSPFKNAQDKDATYLLRLEPNRLLHRFYANAGLPTKGEVYGGWESDGLSGHTLGHYLSACAMMYASTGNLEFKTRVDYIVTELGRCQTARKNGYVGAIPKEDTLFARVARGDIKTGGFDLNGGWSPWYTVHKVMAGLVDAYLYCDNAQALKIVSSMADWTGNILKNLSPELLQKMLKCEYGGMNDVLAQLYALTGNRRYLNLAYQFHDDFVMDPLAKRIDPLPGKHSNTNVPKAIGCATLYEVTGKASDQTIASFFWETMTRHHSYVIGGNSNYEYCGDEDKLNDRLSDNTCETCNTYNMLKLTRHLFAWQPQSQLMDYYERALYNHILASQNPQDGMMCYFVPLRMGTKKTFSDEFNTFTCCVGSGMENHSKYTEGIYSEGKDGSLWVNLFIASELNWKAKGLKITQNTDLTKDNAGLITFAAGQPQAFILRLREPAWVKGGIAISLNGKTLNLKSDANGYVAITRTWKTGDKLSVQFPMELYTESMPDNPNRIAFLYGPLVMAAQLGKEMPDPVYGTPVLLTSNRNIKDWMKPETTSTSTRSFAWQGVGKPFDAKLQPFYSTTDQYYSVYFDFFTPEEFTARQMEYEAEKKRQQEIDAQTIDYFRIGEMQPERDHKLEASERSYVSDALGIMGREARADNFFAFDLKVDASKNNVLLLSYIGDDKDRKFDVVVDGTKLAYVEWNGGKTSKFYAVEYALPANFVAGKDKVRVRIEAKYGKTAGRVFGARVLGK